MIFEKEFKTADTDYNTRKTTNNNAKTSKKFKSKGDTTSAVLPSFSISGIGYCNCHFKVGNRVDLVISA